MNYKWRPANGLDVQHIVKMAQDHFQVEIDHIFTPEPTTYARNITLAIIQQFYGPLSTLFSVCVDDDNQIKAYLWAGRNERAPWSDDEMIVIKMVHLDLSLNARLRIQLIKDMIQIWENWAKLCNVDIICSTTMRKEQDAFLKIHKKQNYDIRGSYAYKRLSTTQDTLAN